VHHASNAIQDFTCDRDALRAGVIGSFRFGPPHSFKDRLGHRAARHFLVHELRRLKIRQGQDTDNDRDFAILNASPAGTHILMSRILMHWRPKFASRNVEFSEPLKDTDIGLRGFELKGADSYVLFFGRPR
jgi:hypothetical protein